MLIWRNLIPTHIKSVNNYSNELIAQMHPLNVPRIQGAQGGHGWWVREGVLKGGIHEQSPDFGDSGDGGEETPEGEHRNGGRW